VWGGLARAATDRGAERCIPARERRIAPTDPFCGQTPQQPAVACFFYGATGPCCTATGHFQGGRSNHFLVYNTNFAGLPFNQRLQITCQEQGHATGLGHRQNSLTSCMHPTVGDGASSLPDGHDYFMLRARIYNH